MSISHPIIKPTQMREPLICNPIGADWKNSMKGCWWATNSTDDITPQMELMLVLRDKLLSFGGEEASLPITESDYDAIMQRGEFFYGKGLRLRKGEPSQCHTNSCLLWEANKGRCSIATGYALSQDGMWRQHSWVVQPLTVKYRVWETTKPRVAYYGFIMTNEECEIFYNQNT